MHVRITMQGTTTNNIGITVPNENQNRHNND